MKILSRWPDTKTNPNKPNLEKDKMNVSSLTTKDYRKNDVFVVRINKPNLVRPALFAKELPDWSKPISNAMQASCEAGHSPRVVSESVAKLLQLNCEVLKSIDSV